MTTTTVASHIVDTLAAQGVERVYGVVGDSLNSVSEAIRTLRARRVAVAPPLAKGATTRLDPNASFPGADILPNVRLISAKVRRDFYRTTRTRQWDSARSTARN